MVKLPTQITGNIGLYHVCYRLSQMGWNVMPTARNARGIDIVCFNMDGTRTITVQVKTLTKRAPAIIGAHLDNIVGDFWTIVTNAATSEPLTYILTPAEVKELATGRKTKGPPMHRVTPANFGQPQFLEAWKRIGYGIPNLERADKLDGDEWFEEAMREERNRHKK